MKWFLTNWKLVAVCAAMFSCAAVGYGVRGYIATAEKNKATVDAQNQKTDKEQKGNEKLAEIERKNAKRRETTRGVASQLAKNRGVNGERVACVASPDGVRGINAIRGADDTRLDK